MRLPTRKWLLKAGTLLVSTCVSLVLGEFALRAALPEPNKYYVLQPRMRRVFRPSPEVMPGVEGESRYITNSEGVRGQELTPDFTYRILAVGGSTTECLYLDQDEAWPQLLQTKLNENKRPQKVWVGNVGRSGLNSRDHVVQLRHLLEQYHNIDAVVLLVGANDLVLRLRQDANYDPDFMRRADAEQVLLPRNFSVFADESLPFYKKTALWRLLRGARTSVLRYLQDGGEIQDEAGKVYVTWREHRRMAAAIRRTPPDLTRALGEYAENIGALIDLARSKSVRLILVTQPAMWRCDISQELNDLLWMGGVGDFQNEGGKGYYSVEALAAALALYNETLLKTCRERRAECFDLAPLLPKDTNAFYDDVHFNEGGARKVADALTKYLTENRPL